MKEISKATQQNDLNQRLTMTDGLFTKTVAAIRGNTYTSNIDLLRIEVERTREEYAYIVDQLSSLKSKLIQLRNQKYELESTLKELKMRDYTAKEGLIIVKEMMDKLCLDMVAKKLATQSVTLYIGYSHAYGAEVAKGTASFSTETNADSIIVPAVAALYQRIVNSAFAIRRICLCCNSVVADQGVLQLNMFEDTTKQIRNKAIQETMLSIKARYGKNAILKGMNYEEAATGRERNMQIGGHKSGTT